MRGLKKARERPHLGLVYGSKFPSLIDIYSSYCSRLYQVFKCLFLRVSSLSSDSGVLRKRNNPSFNITGCYSSPVSVPSIFSYLNHPLLPFHPRSLLSFVLSYAEARLMLSFNSWKYPLFCYCQCHIPLLYLDEIVGSGPFMGVPESGCFCVLHFILKYRAIWQRYKD